MANVLTTNPMVIDTLGTTDLSGGATLRVKGLLFVTDDTGANFEVTDTSGRILALGFCPIAALAATTWTPMDTVCAAGFRVTDLTAGATLLVYCDTPSHG